MATVMVPVCSEEPSPGAGPRDVVMDVHVSERAVLVTGDRPALPGPRAALAQLTVVGISQEAEGAVQGAVMFEARAQCVPCRDKDRVLSLEEREGALGSFLVPTRA